MTVYCGGKKRHGGLCTQAAGWGTSHPGTGKCKLHGGASTGPIKHGLYAVKHQQSLAAKLNEYLDTPNPESLASELALLRALLQDLLDKVTDGSLIGPAVRDAILTLIDAIGRTVERDAKVRNANALTAAEVTLLLAALKAGTEKYIDDPNKRAAFIGEIRATLGLNRPVGAEHHQLTE